MQCSAAFFENVRNHFGDSFELLGRRLPAGRDLLIDLCEIEDIFDGHIGPLLTLSLALA